jgi:hypothetical protein
MLSPTRPAATGPGPAWCGFVDSRRTSVEAVRFVGRTAILGEVAAALAAARAGHGGLVVLSGNAGAGKTWAAEEAARRAEGFRVFWGWCQRGGVGAYQPWARVLREIAEADERCGRVVAGSEPLRTLLAGRVGDLSAPQRNVRRPDTGHDPAEAAGSAAARDPETARLRLTGDVAALLHEAARTTPTLLVLDDVHDADASSLRLLQDLVSTVRADAIVILAAARPGPAATALARLGRTLPVGPLSTEDVAALAASDSRPADPVLVAALVNRTGGDAFFVAELLRHSGFSSLATVPASVRDAVHNRTLSLPVPCRSLLAAASALGTRFRLDVLADVSGIPLAEVGDLLDEAARAGITQPSSEPGIGCFRHDLMREAVYDALSPHQQADLHSGIAAVLIKLMDRGQDVQPAEVAEHLVRAGPGTAGTAAEYARRAADQAAGLLAFDDAVHWYEVAQATDPEAGRRADLSIALGSARLGQGDRGGARRDFLRGAAAAREAGHVESLAEAALGLGAGPAGFEVDLVDREQIDLLEEARTGLAALDAGPVTPGKARSRARRLRALVTARLSVATTLMEPVERRATLAEEAVALARADDDPGALTYALSALCDVRSGPDHHADRLRWSAEMIGNARRIHDLPLELLGRRFRLVALLEAGTVVEAEAEALAYEAAAKLLHQPLYLWYVPLWRGMRALLQGRYDDCLAALEETEELGRRAGSGNAEILAMTQRWCLLIDRGDREGLLRALRNVPPLDQLPGVWPRVSLALLAAQQGDLEQAARQLSAVAPQLGEAPLDSEWLPMLAQVAEAVALTGPDPIAGEAYALLEPYAELFVVEGIGAAVRGPVHRSLALLATAMGDTAAATRHLARTRELAEAIGAPGWSEPLPAMPGSADVPVPPQSANVFRNQGDWWTLQYRGREARIRDSKGLRDLAVLLSRPGTPVPALDLATASAAGPSAAAAEADLHEPGGLGDVIDARARAAYRRRLEELGIAAEEADALGDQERSTRISIERDALVEQLSAAYGLGGRPRRAGSPAERARSTVTARIRTALDRISQTHPELGRHLRASIHTGTLCVYEPETEQHWAT